MFYDNSKECPPKDKSQNTLLMFYDNSKECPPKDKLARGDTEAPWLEFPILSLLLLL